LSLLSLGQLQLKRLAALGNRGFFGSLLRRELIQPDDGARRLLVGRFELLALGGVLVDLAEDLVPLPLSALYRPLYVDSQEPQFSRATTPASAMSGPMTCAIPLSLAYSTSASLSSRSTTSPATSRWQ
jgi:hypothetical protein